MLCHVTKPKKKAFRFIDNLKEQDLHQENLISFFTCKNILEKKFTFPI
jgi:hypothetical protein